jgi:YD repeat-containing protein
MGYDLDESSLSEVRSVTDDVILEQSETTFDNSSNAIQSVQRQRYHNAPDSQKGALQDPSSTPRARVAFSAIWPDGAGRNQASADYGTNGGTALSRPSTIPVRSDTVLVASMTYDSAGNMLQMTDPGGMVTRFAYDARDPQTSKILNYLTSSSSSSSSSSSE